MLTPDQFQDLFDQEGLYKSGDGEIDVVFLTNSGAKYPGKLQFKNGLLIVAQMDRSVPWKDPNEEPLDGLKFLLQFDRETSRAVFVEQGRVAHIFEPRNHASREEFLANVRVARNLYRHSRPAGVALEDNSDLASSVYARGALWLAPKALEGFNAVDFPELKAERRAELLAAVQKFHAITSQISADQAPTDEQYRNAATAFVTALSILSPYLPPSEESTEIERGLRKVTFPSWVVNWDYRLGSSEDGDPAVWVDIFAEENVARSDYSRFVSQIVPEIRQALSSEGVRLWPYIRLRTAAEYRVV